MGGGGGMGGGYFALTRQARGVGYGSRLGGQAGSDAAKWR
jgi:hypothetical protein